MTAAGAIVLDRTGGEPTVLLVHRPAYDDWSLPKGKPEPNETLPVCAVREVLEETAVTVRLGQPVDAIRYSVGGGEKEVRYWMGTTLATGYHRPDKEVDRVVWLSARAALARMTYGDERALLDRALTLPPTIPLLIIRHGKALERAKWTGHDEARPLKPRGCQESVELVPLLRAYGVGRLASSNAIRCLQTLEPYATASGLEVRGWSTLSEEFGVDHETAVTDLMKRLASQSAADGVPLAVCGHRPVLPAMLSSVQIVPRPMETAAVAVAHLDAAGATAAVEWHRPTC